MEPNCREESIVLHLFAFEFLLSKEDMEKVKGMVRSIFKSVPTPKFLRVSKSLV